MRDIFYADIAKNPEDDSLRLICADWLEEEGGDPARAEFIRAQVGFAKTPREELRRLAASLEWSYGARWLREDLPGSLLPIKSEWFYGWRRGFIGGLTVPCGAWIRYGPALVKTLPLEEVGLGNRSPYAPGAPFANLPAATWYLEDPEVLAQWLERYQSVISGASLPLCLYEKLLGWQKPPSRPPDGRSYYVDSEWDKEQAIQRANSALSRACLAWARSV